ncbi:hypothetical protein [Paenibacillus eucommiae]|uniref:Uncharacterized protein n=1 Tax=Paenibacillus eucommiae TaxID=1355755 RepID=A0ABS4J1J4_9BACL|nr:hypothetical protein [Paenibacillus eucommiae]MBP1993699.1 hypothetical protein [Paenibacillus eucommiae]
MKAVKTVKTSEGKWREVNLKGCGLQPRLKEVPNGRRRTRGKAAAPTAL